MIKLFKRTLRTGVEFYESRIAPWIAKNARWTYWPLYWICRRHNICFVVNIAGGVGHIICELDYFFRKLKEKEIDTTKRYVWVRKSDPYSKACVDLYRENFWWTTCNYLLYELLLPLTIGYPEITLDSGLSRLKWQLDPNKNFHRPLKGQTYLHQLSKTEGIQLWEKYYELRNKEPSFFPLTEGKFKLALPFLEKDKKLALIHLKTDANNATALPTDPSTYLPAMQSLIERGYQLIFVGREKMPHIFQSLPIFNYSESIFANFRNDIELFNRSDLVITGGSGISFLADCYGKPYLYLNSWHLPMSMYSPRCIVVPTLVETKKGHLLKFLEQIQLYYDLEDKGAEMFPLKEYVPRNASGEEILNALEELLSLKDQPTSLQKQYKELNKNSPLYLAQANCSDSFLQKHRELFN